MNLVGFYYLRLDISLKVLLYNPAFMHSYELVAPILFSDLELQRKSCVIANVGK